MPFAQDHVGNAWLSQASESVPFDSQIAALSILPYCLSIRTKANDSHTVGDGPQGTICGASLTCYGSCLFVLLLPLLDWEIC